MSARAATSSHSVTNTRGETIEVGFVVTVLEEEHVYGTGEVTEIRGALGRPHFAKVSWEDSEVEWSFLHVDELTNINLAARDRAINGS
jgi:hypothetical protein